MVETEPRCLKNGEYFAVYAKVFAFHKKHINACTDTDWNNCAADLDQFETPFEIDLAVAVINELERDRKNRSQEKRLTLGVAL